MKPTEHHNRLQSLLNRWRGNLPASREIELESLFAADGTGHREMPLSRMRPGEFGHILSICSCCEAREHLLELGFTPGIEITVLRVAPLGDPMTVRVRGYQLSLRRREAEAIKMRRCPPEFPLDAFPQEQAGGARGE